MARQKIDGKQSMAKIITGIGIHQLGLLLVFLHGGALLAAPLASDSKTFYYVVFLRKNFHN